MKYFMLYPPVMDKNRDLPFRADVVEKSVSYNHSRIRVLRLRDLKLEIDMQTDLRDRYFSFDTEPDSVANPLTN